MIQLLINHLWQSTVFAGVAGLLTLVLRKNHARTRYWIWLAASVKFLVPFFLLVSAGGRVQWTHSSPPPRQVSTAIQQIKRALSNRCFSSPA
jgi:bla regulator protein blaR1